MKRGLSFASVFALILVAGCTSTPAGSSGTGMSGRYPMTEAGARFYDGQLVLEKVESPEQTGGTLDLRIKNVSGKPLENLSASVIFYMPPTGVQEYDTEGVEHRFSIFRGETVDLKLTPSHPNLVKGWRVSINPGLTVTPTQDHAGTSYLGGKLECVGIDDELGSSKPSISFTVQSHASATEYIEYKVILMQDGKTVWESHWKSLSGGVPAGRRVVLSVPVDRDDLGSADAVLSIRETVL